ncbi:MAG: single-stranded-DNA-specific exonuclease RecJ [Clostridia bacterium]|nr:single-stranded-DNA-specific exonuclease RecJ [Clostridia bacterium]
MSKLRKPKRWQVAQVEYERIGTICARVGINPLLAQVLVARGIDTAEKVQAFINVTGDQISEPTSIGGVEQAANILVEAITRDVPILVYGDYDVDGITATALLVDLLRRCGARVGYYIPDRLSEGYGLNSRALLQLREQGYRLVVTVDCGISNYQVISDAKLAGFDVLVTDHHQLPDRLPPASAIVHPALGENQGTKLAGVGVAFKLAQQVSRGLGMPKDAGIDAGRYLDLVALGTIADLVPLLGENRVLTKIGLEQLNRSPRLGLKALREVAGISYVDSRSVAFGLAPRLNAAGRLGQALPAVQLLLTDSYQEAWEIARELDQINRERQLIEESIFQQAQGMAREQVEANSKFIVLSSPYWHPGIVGIVASRLVEEYYLPVLLIALAGRVGKGSARSIPGFHMYEALSSCHHLLESFGGHELAAGLTVEVEKISDLRQELNAVAERCLCPEDLVPKIDVDTEIVLSEVTIPAVEQLSLLEPYGPGNDPPVFLYRHQLLQGIKGVGKDNSHLKGWINGEGRQISIIGFNLVEGFEQRQPIDLVFHLGLNEWQGQAQIEARLLDWRPSAPSALAVDDSTLLVQAKAKSELACTSSGERKLINWTHRAKAGWMARIESIKEVAKVEDQVLIWVRRRSLAGQVLRSLYEILPELTGRIFLASKTLTQEQLQLVIGFWKNRLAQIVVVEGLDWFEPPVAGAIIFLEPPLSLNQLYNITGECSKVYLLWHEWDIDYIDRCLEMSIPGRETVATVYRYLLYLKRGNFKTQVDTGRISRDLNRILGKTIGRKAIWRSLAILKEIGLVQHLENECISDVLLLEPTGRKISLEDSLVYRDGQAKLAQWRECKSFFQGMA